MKIPFVTRKKYEKEKQNNIILNKERLNLSNKNKQLQEQLKEYEKQIAFLEETIDVFEKSKTQKVTKTKAKTTTKSTTKKTKKKEEK